MAPVLPMLSVAREGLGAGLCIETCVYPALALSRRPGRFSLTLSNEEEDPLSSLSGAGEWAVLRLHSAPGEPGGH